MNNLFATEIVDRDVHRRATGPGEDHWVSGDDLQIDGAPGRRRQGVSEGGAGPGRPVHADDQPGTAPWTSGLLSTVAGRMRKR